LLILTPLSDIVLGRVGQGATPSRLRAERRRRDAASGPPSRLPLYLPFAAALALYMSAREVVLGSALGTGTSLGTDALMRLIGALGHYLFKLVLPVRQSAYISDLSTGALALLGTTVSVLLLAVLCLHAWRGGQRTVSFLLLWIGLTLAPSLAIVFKIPAAPVAERYLYLPSAGYCLLLAYGATRLFSALTSREARTALAAVVVVLLCLGAAATVRRNAVWRSNLTLWEDTAAKNVTDGLPMRSLATAYQQLGEAAKAKEYFLLALKRRNDAAGLLTIYNNLGSLAMTQKKLDEAEGYYRSALASNPGAADALFNLALIGLTRAKDEGGTHNQTWKHQQAERARRLFEQAQQLSPLDPDIPVGLGQTLSVLGDAAGARKAYERALQLGLPPATDAAVRSLLRELQ
jgi:tetratricopeptide (TPR) repeat protein